MEVVMLSESWFMTDSAYEYALNKAKEGEIKMRETIEIINRKLEEAYKHIKPYMDRKNCPQLYDMCAYCEKWCGDEHNYKDCENMPCFKNWLAYVYLKWEASFENGE